MERKKLEFYADDMRYSSSSDERQLIQWYSVTDMKTIKDNFKKINNSLDKYLKDQPMLENQLKQTYLNKGKLRNKIKKLKEFNEDVNGERIIFTGFNEDTHQRIKRELNHLNRFENKRDPRIEILESLSKPLFTTGALFWQNLVNNDIKHIDFDLMYSFLDGIVSVLFFSLKKDERTPKNAIKALTKFLTEPLTDEELDSIGAPPIAAINTRIKNESKIKLTENEEKYLKKLTSGKRLFEGEEKTEMDNLINEINKKNDEAKFLISGGKRKSRRVRRRGSKKNRTKKRRKTNKKTKMKRRKATKRRSNKRRRRR